MSKELFMVIDAVCNEKDLDRDDIFGAIESALAAAIRRKRGSEMDVRVEMERENGDTKAFRRWLVVDDDDPSYESPDYHVLLSQARRDNPDIEAGNYIEKPIDGVSFGRISAHTAKQVIIQKVREAERSHIADMYRDQVGNLVMGSVKREDYNGVYVDLGNNAEGFIPRENTILRENFRTGDRIRAYLARISEEGRGLRLVLSRTAPEFLIGLFKLEVPEIGQGLIEIMGAARDPGLRAKIAVRSNDASLDPVGACVGMRGSRVQAVSNELSGERIDIIKWEEDPAKYVIKAMSPATVVSIVVDEEKKSMDIAVEEDKLSQAIGRGGQNVQLASKLVGWNLEVMSEEQAEEKSEKETQLLQNKFRESLSVDEEVAAILVQEGFTSIEEIVYAPLEDLLAIEEFEQSMVDEMRARAQDVLLSMAISGELDKDEPEEQTDLTALENMDEATAQQLSSKGIDCVEKLAELAVDELLDISTLDRRRAAEFIIAARKPWFEEERKE